MPDILGGGTGAVRPTTPSTHTGSRGSVAVGILDGLSLMPTVGGILSLDLLASASLLFLSESDRLSGESRA